MTEQRRPQDLPRDEAAALVSAYALDALDPDDAAMAEQLIASSPEWRAAYEDALETTALLAQAAPPSTPPPALRDRILAAARAEGAPEIETVEAAPAPPASLAAARERRRLLTPSRVVAVVAAVAACVAIGFALSARSEIDDLESEAAGDQAIAAALAAPGATLTPLATPDGAGGAALVRTDGDALLVATLPAAPSAETYQLWGLDATGAPLSLGTFEGGDEQTLVVPASALSGQALVAVTVEPDGGSPAPTGDPILVGELS